MTNKALKWTVGILLGLAIISYASKHPPTKDDPRLPIPTAVPSIGFRNPIK